MARDEIRITWLGHSCFRIVRGDYSVVFDPYRDGSIPGYAPLRTQADEVFLSHGHDDHNFREGVTLHRPAAQSPFTVTKIVCPHDDARGAKRGMNTIYVLDDGILRLAHFGDIGCPLDSSQREKIGHLDAALVPVGGYFTMDPAGIEELMQQLNPCVVIPMHYRFGSYGYPVIGTVDDYLRLVKGTIRRYPSNTFVLTEETTPQTAVLTFPG